MDEITRIETLNDAFRAVQARTKFIYYHSPELHFVYQPFDDDFAGFIASRLDRYPEPEDYEPVMKELGIFVWHSPFERFTVGRWHCIQFALKRQRLTL